MKGRADGAGGAGEGLIGQAVTDAVRSGFATRFNDMGYAEHPDPPPTFRAGSERAGHDASRVPEVPQAWVESAITDGEAGIAFSYKVEYGDEPQVELSVPRTWARQVADAAPAGRSWPAGRWSTSWNGAWSCWTSWRCARTATGKGWDARSPSPFSTRTGWRATGSP
ncbi:hypothetical protein ACFVT6_19575 [Streptomyces sp. NPDC058049]|uniref:hypothetical protein n=1 Tax=Streptomyces sp. NPDC058049 TaxID=3346314 RepID=UPI0036EFB8E8